MAGRLSDRPRLGSSVRIAPSGYFTATSRAASALLKRGGNCPKEPILSEANDCAGCVPHVKVESRLPGCQCSGWISASANTISAICSAKLPNWAFLSRPHQPPFLLFLSKRLLACPFLHNLFVEKFYSNACSLNCVPQYLAHSNILNSRRPQLISNCCIFSIIS